MKKVLILIAAVMVVGCAEKAEYEQAVLQQVKKDNDIKDYNIEPKIMVDCVVQTSSKNMSGLLPFDPARRQAYKNYSKMLRLNESEDPQKTMTELREAFGSPKALAEAHANFAESVLECMSGVVTNKEEGMK
jgi:hypothetical protein